MSDDPNAPNRETLRGLRDMLPSYATQVLEKKKLSGKRIPVKPVEAELQPTKVCECCGVLFDKVRNYEGSIESGVCVKCKWYLDAGYIAIVSKVLSGEHQCAFLIKGYAPEMSGKIVFVEPKTFAFAKQKAAEQERVKNESNGQSP